MMKKSNIILIGFMGTGKTCVGKELQKLSGYNFIDTDALIEELEETTISELFSNKGEKYFRDAETHICEKLIDYNKMIISTGGGIIISEQNKMLLKNTGNIFLLTASPQEILKRLGTNRSRPILNVDNPREKIEELLEARQKHYEISADFSIDTNENSCRDVAEKIWYLYQNEI
jgi:shikimate kinase